MTIYFEQLIAYIHEMAEIKTFVFFDIETTDLIINGVLPKIAELSFIACSREHFLDADTRKVPRTLPKLVLPVSPVKRIHPMATFKNGMYFLNIFFHVYNN